MHLVTSKKVLLGFQSPFLAARSAKAILVFLVLTLLAFRCSRRDLFLIGILASTTLAVHACVSIFLKDPPFRVYFPSFIALVVFVGMCVGRGRAFRATARLRRFMCDISSWLATSVIVLSLFLSLSESRRRDVSWGLLKSEIEWMSRKDHAAFLQVASAVNFDLRFPLGEMELPGELELIASASVASSPPVSDQLRRLGAINNSMALLEQPRVSLMLLSGEDKNENCGYNEGLIRLLRQYLEERHGKTIKAVRVSHCNTQWSFVSLEIVKSVENNEPR